jgi:hypothetical protein
MKLHEFHVNNAWRVEYIIDNFHSVNEIFCCSKVDPILFFKVKETSITELIIFLALKKIFHC